MRRLLLLLGTAVLLPLTVFATHDADPPLTVAQTAETTLPLASGFTLVGWTGDDHLPSPALADAVGSAFTAAFAFDATSQRFRSFRPDAPPFLNDLDAVPPGEAVWIQTARSASLAVPASSGPRFVPLLPGFNLVAWSGPSGTDPATAFATLSGTLAAAFTYDVVSGAFRRYSPDAPAFLNTLATLNYGDGLYLQMTFRGDWSVPASAGESTDDADVYRVTNPTSGAALHTVVVHPSDWDGSALPALVLVPGGTGSGTSSFLDSRNDTQTIADSGFTVIVFDPDGRGLSDGTEDQNGFAAQDGLAAVIDFAATLPEAQSGALGVASVSFGITMAAGALARHPTLPVAFLIDWEGPANRDDTAGCDGTSVGHLGGVVACDDEAFWAEREALTFIADVPVPYQRLQPQRDHAQPDNEHARAMVNAAVAGAVPWVRLNTDAPNRFYPSGAPLPLLPDSVDSDVAGLIADNALDLLALP